MSASNYYLLVANEKLLCSAEGNLVVLPEPDYLRLPLEIKIHHPVVLSEGRHISVVDVVEQPLEGYQWLALRSQLGKIPEFDFQLAGRGLQILRWHYEHQFCGRCGRPTEQQVGELAKSCTACKLDFYPRLSPCIITLVTRGDYCLLAWHTRSKEERYSCLAGFVEAGESPEQTLVREVMEEVGIAVDNIRYVASQPWPFPGQLMLGFLADYSHGEICIDQQEIQAANWYRYDQLPNIPPKSTISRRLIDEFVQQRTSLAK